MVKPFDCFTRSLKNEMMVLVNVGVGLIVGKNSDDKLLRVHSHTIWIHNESFLNRIKLSRDIKDWISAAAAR